MNVLQSSVHFISSRKKIFLLLWTIIYAVCILISGVVTIRAQEERPLKYYKIKIINPDKTKMDFLARAGMALDEWRPDGPDVIAHVNEKELAVFRSAGISFRILIDDLSRYYEERNQMTRKEINELQDVMRKKYGVEGFKFGSMGGYLTYDQIRYEIDTMIMRYPNLIKQDNFYGYTLDGNYILAYKISKNPNINDTNKTEVMYNGLIHAREPMSMMSLIYFMYYLLENYGRDPDVTYLLEHRVLWFIPCINPDGYRYNQTTNPNGGGMWRKNRWRGSNNTVYGVDLNRNFGYMWGYDNIGSSPDSSDETFRGRSAFSERESRFIRDFCNLHRIKTQVDGHTYGHYFMYPWAYINAMTPDSIMYTRMAMDIVQNTAYVYGYSGQLLGYNSNGSARDWEYGEQGTKPTIFAYTNEIGNSSDDFWAPVSRIYPLCQELVNPYLYVAWAGGKWALLENYTFDKIQYVPGDSGTLKIMLRSKGVDVNFSYAHRLTCAEEGVFLPDTNGIGSFTVWGEPDTLIYKFYIADTAYVSGGFRLNLEVKCGPVDLLKRTFTVAMGTPETVFSDDAENGTGNWSTVGSTGGAWNTATSSYHSSSHSFTDSPSGNYARLSDLRLSMVTSLDFTNYPVVQLRFWQRYATQSYHDFCDVDVSTNGGTQWLTADHVAGINTTWHEKTVDISRWAGGKNNVKIRFRLTSNDTIQQDGWYIDDIAIQGYRSPATVGIHGDAQPGHGFSLEQNYPNPFNPATTIRFVMKESGYVKLRIYNMLGQEVCQLIDGYQSRGERAIFWNGTNRHGSPVSAGVYICKLEAVTAGGKFSQARKMILLK